MKVSVHIQLVDFVQTLKRDVPELSKHLESSLVDFQAIVTSGTRLFSSHKIKGHSRTTLKIVLLLAGHYLVIVWWFSKVFPSGRVIWRAFSIISW